MDKTKISSQIRRDLKIRGWEDDELVYVSRILGEEGYTDPRYARKRLQDVTLESLTSGVKDLLKPVDDERFNELHNSTNDTMPILAEYDLNYDQITKLSQAERQQYRDIRAKLFSEQKATISHGQTNFEDKMGNSWPKKR